MHDRRRQPGGGHRAHRQRRRLGEQIQVPDAADVPMLKRAGRLTGKPNNAPFRDLRRHDKIRGVSGDDPNATAESSRGDTCVDDGSANPLGLAETVARHMADEYVVRSRAWRTICSTGLVRSFGWGRG
jgi:hypothetical protein